MKSTDLFDSMNDIPDELIQAAEVSPEAMAAGGYGATSGEKRRDFFARVTSSGWFVAAVSLIVAFGVVALILRAGRATPGIVNPPVGGTSAQEGMQSTQPMSDSAENGDLSFAYRLTSGTYSPGDTVSFTASLTHRGDAYTFSGSPDELAPEAKLVCRSYELNVGHLIREIWTEMTVKNGDTFSSNYFVILPEDCPEGSYDLILSYGDTAVTFRSVLRISRTPAEGTVDGFSFSYRLLSAPNPDGGYTYLQTGTILVEVTVTYAGYPLGNVEPVPKVELIQPQTGFVLPLQVQRDTVAWEIATDGKTAAAVMTFVADAMPETTPAGAYDLVLTAYDAKGQAVESQRFSSVLSLTAAWEATVGDLTFGHTTDVTVVEPGECVTVYGYVINNGSAFTYFGNESDFAPDAYLICGDTRIEAIYSVDEAEPSNHTVESGQIGDVWLTFEIPEDAPCGSYAMVFTYGDVSYVFCARINVVADKSRPVVGSSEEETEIREPSFDEMYFTFPATEGLVYKEVNGEIGVVGVEENCLSLEEIHIPTDFDKPVTFIGEEAFRGCTALQTLYMPKGVERLFDYALDGCPKLRTVYYQGYFADWERVIAEAPYWNGNAPMLTVICRDRTVTYEGTVDDSVPAM